MTLGPFSFTDFAHPHVLWLLLIIVALIVAAVISARRRRQRALAFSNIALLDSLVHKRRRWLERIPAVLAIAALTAGIIGFAGPTASQEQARNRTTVMLLMDVSLSMQATDVSPNRLEAAQQAGKEFVGDLPADMNIGLVTFAGTATVDVSPGPDRGRVQRAIDSVTLRERTATGEAIFAGLNSIEQLGQQITGPEGPPPAHIILLSDGKQTVPASPEDQRGAFTAAQAAADAGIPVSTISFGTTTGTITIGPDTLAVPVDTPSLAEIAAISGGQAYTAASLADLRATYADLTTQIGYETVVDDASRPWLGLAVLCGLLATALTLVVSGRIP